MNKQIFDTKIDDQQVIIWVDTDILDNSCKITIMTLDELGDGVDLNNLSLKELKNLKEIIDLAINAVERFKNA